MWFHLQFFKLIFAFHYGGEKQEHDPHVKNHTTNSTCPSSASDKSVGYNQYRVRRFKNSPPQLLLWLSWKETPPFNVISIRTRYFSISPETVRCFHKQHPFVCPQVNAVKGPILGRVLKIRNRWWVLSQNVPMVTQSGSLITVTVLPTAEKERLLQQVGNHVAGCRLPRSV